MISALQRVASAQAVARTVLSTPDVHAVAINGENITVDDDAISQVVVEQPGPAGGEMWLATLADPDGNYFQLVTPMDMP